MLPWSWSRSHSELFRLRGKGSFANIPLVIIPSKLEMKANKKQSRNILPRESVDVAHIFSWSRSRHASLGRVSTAELGKNYRNPNIWSRSRRRSWELFSLESELEPWPGTEYFPGAGAGAVQDFSGPASLLLSIQCHPCGLESFWLFGTLLTARRPPGQKHVVA